MLGLGRVFGAAKQVLTLLFWFTQITQILKNI